MKGRRGKCVGDDGVKATSHFVWEITSTPSSSSTSVFPVQSPQDQESAVLERAMGPQQCVDGSSEKRVGIQLKKGHQQTHLQRIRKRPQENVSFKHEPNSAQSQGTADTAEDHFLFSSSLSLCSKPRSMPNEEGEERKEK